jgi:hypothetical protein
MTFLNIDKFGIWYHWLGDEICLPNKEYREKGKLWYSTCWNCFFSSLQEMVDFEDSYWRAERRTVEDTGNIND